MPTSATGRCSSSPSASPRSIRGFTLIEIMVVMLIIAIATAGMMLSLNAIGGDRELERERERIVAATDYVREQATLQNREFGMRVFDGGYEFLSWEPQSFQWERIVDDPLLRARTLPPGIQARLIVEGRPVVLPTQQAKGPAPQILLFSSGDLNSFELRLQRPVPHLAQDDWPAQIFTANLQTSRIDVRSAQAGQK